MLPAVVSDMEKENAVPFRYGACADYPAVCHYAADAEKYEHVLDHRDSPGGIHAC
jgi:hypothetical protein